MPEVKGIAGILKCGSGEIHKNFNFENKQPL
jgi:hypothetical protein